MRDRSDIAPARSARAHHLLAPLALCASIALALPALAVPPPGAAIGAATLPKARWIEHRVIPGERISEICDRYGVREQKLIEWNKLDRDRPRLRAGQELRLWTRSSPVDRQKVRYTVRRGDSWARIARKHDVDASKLRKHWNRQRTREGALQAGETIIVWVEREERPETPSTTVESTATEAGPAPPQVTVPSGSFSVGSPSRGRLLGGERMPDNPTLYTLRKPENSYASTHTITHLQGAIASFRERTGFDREIVIADMSRKRGGRFRPHRSHRSGRDVDIRLPLAAGVAQGTVPESAEQVDWDATWAFMRELIDTGQVDYIFLSRHRQRLLVKAAQRAGVGEAELAQLIQFPASASSRTAVVRHSRGHDKHFHVRFKCGPAETRCRD